VPCRRLSSWGSPRGRSVGREACSRRSGFAKGRKGIAECGMKRDFCNNLLRSAPLHIHSFLDVRLSGAGAVNDGVSYSSMYAPLLDKPRS
jgi:hypothetical protein